VIHYLAVGLAVVLCSIGCLAQTPPPYQVYFVSVGSAWYVTPSGKGVHGFSRIPGANKSAKVLSAALISGGAEYGILLTSADHQFVTVGDVYQAVKKVGNRIQTDRPQHPLFLFYFAGHGLSEGIAWNHFSIPGDFTYEGDAANLDIEGLSNSTLYAGALVDELESFHIPFVLLLDNCYDATEKSFESPVLSGTATKNLKDVGGILRVLNEFRNTYPVLFSTTPGTSVLTVEDPSDPNAPVTIGPLARRFLLSVSSVLDQRKAVALETFLEQMTSPSLDPLTSPAVMHSPAPHGANAPFLVPNRPAHPIEEVLGTGHTMQICCRSAPIPATPTLQGSSNFAGKLSVTGEPGEYISYGKTQVFSTPSFRVTVTQSGPGNIRMRFERGETEFDASFSTASGERFAARAYPAAQRSGMADPGHPGLEISGDGRGCGDIAGSFQVSEVAYDQDGTISKFVSTFMQLCDTAKVPAQGTIELLIKR
jgi:hypothetical protein